MIIEYQVGDLESEGIGEVSTTLVPIQEAKCIVMNVLTDDKSAILSLIIYPDFTIDVKYGKIKDGAVDGDIDETWSLDETWLLDEED